MEYHIAKGVFDILPQDPDPDGAWRQSHLWQFVENTARQVAKEYGFQEIRTPLFEKTELFQRSIGQTSDIVSKEMYTFVDKGGRSCTLRPEGTAPVMRAFIEKNLSERTSVHKYYYLASMFRYERQQAGRYRQHHQFGVEAIGVSSPLQDVEIIEMLYTFLNRLGIVGLPVHLNSIGDPEARLRYKEALKAKLLPHFEQLSPESQERFHTNPLRILDSKNPEDKKLIADMPSIIDYLSDDSRMHFDTVCSLLKELEIPFLLNPQLVRGLDYYNKTVFEIPSDALGAQNSVGSGGRYDGLIKELGGPPLPAIGFGSGIERIIQTMLASHLPLPTPPVPTLYIIPLGDSALRPCFSLMSQLRKNHIATEMELEGRKLKAAMRQASSLRSKYVVVLGENELASGQVELKNMESGTAETLPINALAKRLQSHG